MKKLGLIKGLGMFSVFYGSSVSFAGSIKERESKAMSSLMGNINQQGVDAFRNEIKVLAKELQNKVDTCNKKRRVESKVVYFLGLVEIVGKVFKYQQSSAQQQQQLRPELEAVARTYGGNVHRLIRSVIHLPAPAP
jgi:hypothetical protein